MKRDAFSFQMKRLTETFGNDNYPKPRVEEIWIECGDLTDDQFAYLITRMIREQPVRYPPLLPLFKEFAETIRKDMIDKPSVEAPIVPDRWGPPKDYKTADEAFSEANAFYRMLYKDRADSKEFDQKFREVGQRFFPELHEQVESLRVLVRSGSIEARSQFVAAARSYMLKVTLHIAMNKISMPETTTEAGA